MAIWDQPAILSGTSLTSEQEVSGDVKPQIGICILHTGKVSTEWAMRFRLLQFPSYVFMLNRNQPYDTGREQITRAVLERGVEYVFHLDTDVLIPLDTVPKMIEWSKQFNLPILSGLYWAKKPDKMPAAWIKTGEHPQENKYDFMPADLTPHLQTGAIVPVDVTGAGCLLVKADVFKKLDKSNPNKPYFQWGLGRKDENTGKPLKQMSEDFYFFTRCIEELGIHPHVCCAVKCDHIATVNRRGADGEYEMSVRI